VTQASAELSFQQTIGRHSKSFALASKLLPPSVRRDALVLYAYCRRADDAVDLAPRTEQPAALAALRDELDAVYGCARGGAERDPVTRAFAEVVRRHLIPRDYPEALVAGMAMDVAGMRYQRWADVQRYSYCVAGSVGRMMCHVMGVRDENALQHAEDLGIAMQLTNICRDVLEDWQRGRLYLPADLLERCGAGEVGLALGGPLPEWASAGLGLAIEHVLDRADDFYCSGDAGLCYLSPRCRLAIRTARLVYSSIGDELRVCGCDPRIGRVFVTTRRKLALAAQAALETWRPQRFTSHKAKPWPPAAT
jgi:15-cis-phytoene synthase